MATENGHTNLPHETKAKASRGRESKESLKQTYQATRKADRAPGSLASVHRATRQGGGGSMAEAYAATKEPDDEGHYQGMPPGGPAEAQPVQMTPAGNFRQPTEETSKPQTQAQTQAQPTKRSIFSGKPIGPYAHYRIVPEQVYSPRGDQRDTSTHFRVVGTAGGSPIYRGGLHRNTSDALREAVRQAQHPEHSDLGITEARVYHPERPDQEIWMHSHTAGKSFVTSLGKSLFTQLSNSMKTKALPPEEDQDANPPMDQAPPPEAVEEAPESSQDALGGLEEGGMPPDDTDVQEGAEESPYATDPYGAQVVRKVVDDLQDFMMEYDGILNPLEQQDVHSLVTELLEILEDKLSGFEKTYKKLYRHLKPLGSEIDDQDEASLEADEDYDTKDTSENDEQAIPADSNPDDDGMVLGDEQEMMMREEPTPEEAYMATVGGCACGQMPCVCGGQQKSLNYGKVSPPKLKGLDQDDFGELKSFLGQLKEEKHFGEPHRQKAFHYSKLITKSYGWHKTQPQPGDQVSNDQMPQEAMI